MATLRRPKTIQEYQEMSLYIYGKINDAHYTNDHLVRRLLEEATSVMDLARKDERDSLYKQLPRMVMWCLAVANRFNIDLQEALWNKYPGICTYCLRQKDCLCGLEHPDVPHKDEIIKRFRRDRNEREPVTLEEHQALHQRLYARQNDRIFLIQTAAHIAEEVGEFSFEERKGNREGFLNEMADVLSWIFALATRLKYNLHDLIWDVFPYECELCKQDVCECLAIP